MNIRRLADNRSHAGFTLIELMVTVAIVAILASIAFPSYRQYVIRGHRSAAKSVMMDLANREQQLLLASRVYADKAALTASGYVLPSEVSDNYGWDVVLPPTPEPSFLITLTPTGAQAGDGALTLDNQGTKLPAAKWQK